MTLIEKQQRWFEYVVLVNEKDEVIGIGEKHEVHRLGWLHRAFSIFVFNSRGELLIQRRALSKYHSGGLWSNTCCGHPRPGEAIEEAAHRRLQEEMGFDCALRHLFSFIYQAELDNGLIENEYDHVFVGKFDGVPVPNESEVLDWKWVPVTQMVEDIRWHPNRYTYWVKKLSVHLTDILKAQA